MPGVIGGLHPHPGSGSVPEQLAKAGGHWIATGLPLVIAAPVYALLLNLPPIGIGALTLTLLVGAGLLFSFLGAALGFFSRARAPAGTKF